MKKIFYITILLSSFLSSCNFLDLDSPDGVEKDKLFETADGLYNARIGMYGALASANYYGGTFPLVASCYSDDGANGGYSVPSYDELGAKTVTSTNILLDNIWISLYNANAIANQILVSVDKIQDATLTTESRAAFKSEALFVRALCHFDALRCWGEHWDMNSTYGIPVISVPQAFDTKVTRATVKESYDFIIKDLAEAESTISVDLTSKNYVTKTAVQALTARVMLYGKDNVNAAKYANDIIKNARDLSLLATADYGKVFTTKTSPESIFEIGFNAQNRSGFNQSTYVRDDANRPEVIYLAAEDLGKFFDSRKSDVRSQLVNFTSNHNSISPDGRTEKYRGEQTRDNPAYVLRLAEMYLIVAEAKGRANGLAMLNALREKRGLPKIASVPSDAAYQTLILEERRAEFNWEGHRYFDLARLGKVTDVLGKDVKSNFPIPSREITASGGTLVQNVGF